MDRRNESLETWEEQLAAIIKKSDRNLAKVRKEVESKKTHSYHYNLINGMYEQNMAISRPRSGPFEDDTLQKVDVATIKMVDHAVNDKLTFTSKAIDALRDQICVIADEVRELKSQVVYNSKNLSSQAQRIDVLCNDGVCNDIDALEADKFEKFKSELKRMMKSSEESMMELFQNELNDKFAAAKSNLIKTIKVEVSKVQKRCFDMSEANMKENFESQRNDTVDIITKILTISLSEVEKSLSSQLTKQLSEEVDDLIAQSYPSSATEEKIQTLQQAIHELSKTLESLKTEMKQTSQSDITLERLKERMTLLHKSQGRNDANLMQAFDYLRQHKELICSINNNAITKEEARKSLSDLKSLSMKQSLDVNVKLGVIKACEERLIANVDDINNLQTRVDVLEEDLKQRLNVTFDDMECPKKTIQSLKSKSNGGEGYQGKVAVNNDDFMKNSGKFRHDFVQMSAHMDKELLTNTTPSTTCCIEEDNLSRALSNLQCTLADARVIGNTTTQSQGAMSLGSPGSIDDISSARPQRYSTLNEGQVSPVVSCNVATIQSSDKWIDETNHCAEYKTIITNECKSIQEETTASTDSTTATGSMTKINASSLHGGVDCGTIRSQKKDPNPRAARVNESVLNPVSSSTSAPENQEKDNCRDGQFGFVVETIFHSNDISPGDDASSIPGSITSFDEVDTVMNSPPITQHKETNVLLVVDHTVDKDIYKRWKQVLAELVDTVSMNQGEENDDSIKNSVSHSGSLLK